MSDRIEAEILDVLGEEVAAAVDTPLVVIEGPKGDPGAPGKDGHSPVVTATKSDKTTTISVDGEAIATVEDGADGAQGKDGAPGIYYGTTQPTGDTHPVWIDPDGGPDDGGLLPAVTAADNGKVLRVVNSAWSASDTPTGGTDSGSTGASIGQIAKITAVDGTGKATAWEAVDMPSGSGGERWRLVRTITLEENVTSIDISEDNDGNPFALKKIRIYGATLGTASGGQLRINVANNNDDRYSILGPYHNFKGLDTIKRWWVAEAECVGIIEGKGKWSEWYNTPDTTKVGAAYARGALRTPMLNSGQYIQDRVEFLHIFSNTSGVDLAAGSDIELWGVDA